MLQVCLKQLPEFEDMDEDPYPSVVLVNTCVFETPS